MLENTPISYDQNLSKITMSNKVLTSGYGKRLKEEPQTLRNVPVGFFFLIQKLSCDKESNEGSNKEPPVNVTFCIEAISLKN
jgi:hypothetical protein